MKEVITMNMYAIVKVFNTGEMEIQKGTIGSKKFTESKMESCLNQDESNVYRANIRKCQEKGIDPTMWIEALNLHENLRVTYQVCQIGIL